MKNLKKLRESRNLSQQEAADGIGISQQQYQRYESGVNEAGYEMLRRIAAFFHVSIDYLLEFDPDPYPAELAYVESKEAGFPIDYEIRETTGDRELDAGLIHLIENYKFCEKDRRAHIQYVVEQITKVARFEKDSTK